MAGAETTRRDVHVYNCCVCANRTARRKAERAAEGTFVPRMSGGAGAAPARTAGRSDNWARRFDAAVSELAALAQEAASAPPEGLEDMQDAVST